MQPAEKLEEILEVAKRVKSSLKESKKGMSIAMVEREEVSDLEDLEAAAIQIQWSKSKRTSAQSWI